MNKLTYFQRKRRQGANFSIEQIFDDLAARFGSKYAIKQEIFPCISSGVLRRAVNLVYAPFVQGDVNHITGDINYVSIFLTKNKSILTIHDLGVLHATTGIKRKILLLIWFLWPINRSRWITVVSEATKIDLLNNVKCNPDKIKVIYVPISQEFKRADKPFNKECPIILQIGGAPNKNLERLIPALQGLKCKLLIIGQISESNLQLLVEYKIDFQNKVGIPFNEVIASYIAADILFFASTFEGFGMPILEAQAVGRAVVTSNILSMPEVGGDAALYVDPYKVSEIRNAILQIIQDEELRADLINKGFGNVKRFDPEVIAAQYDALYQDILAKK